MNIITHVAGSVKDVPSSRKSIWEQKSPTRLHTTGSGARRADLPIIRVRVVNSDDHGFLYPHGFTGMGLAGMGTGLNFEPAVDPVTHGYGFAGSVVRLAKAQAANIISYEC